MAFIAVALRGARRGGSLGRVAAGCEAMQLPSAWATR